jgi:glucose/arabinose dehydrogenase
MISEKSRSSFPAFVDTMNVVRTAVCLIGVALLAFEPVVTAQSSARAVVYATGFTTPLQIVQDPTNRSVQFVVEQGGRIRAIRAGTVVPGEFLNLSNAIRAGGEQGLLGLAFAPDYASSGRFYVYFTNRDGHVVVARFRRSSDPLVADPSSRFDLKLGGNAFVFHPFSNHNGGNLVFGPDGFLYIGLGDGGASNDPGHRAQNPAEFLGKMLRIDVNVPDSDGAGYRVPSDNPFVSSGPAGTRPEIWAFGLRNPWRYSFDDPTLGGTGALVIADVGQDQWEEIDYEPPRKGGRNYGWRNREGAHTNITALPPAFQPLVDPIHEYDHRAGGSITGGFVYRGRALGSTFQGRYFFGDFITGRLWSLALLIDAAGEARASDVREMNAELGVGPVPVSSFGVDAVGELFIVNYGGTILRLVGQPVAPPTPTGLTVVR